MVATCLSLCTSLALIAAISLNSISCSSGSGGEPLITNHRQCCNMTKSPKNQSPIFEGLSLEEPSILSVSFKSDPSASLGVKLSNHDNGLTNEMFLPGYASVGGMLPGKTLARTCGVQSGDYIVAVNGVGYRRFPPDFNDDELKDVTEGLDLITLDSPTKKSEKKGEKDDNENGEDDNDDEEGEEDAIIKQERELKVSIILHYYCRYAYTLGN